MFDTFQPSIYGYMVLAVFAGLFYLIFFRGLSSKKYKFYKEDNGISIKLIRHFLGVVPVHSKTYHNINLDNLDYYEYETTDEDTVYTHARIDLTVNTNENVGDNTEKSDTKFTLVDSTNLKKVDAISAELSDFIDNPHDRNLTIDAGRIKSFLLSLFVFVFWFIFLVLPFIFASDKLLTFNLLDVTVNELPMDNLNSRTNQIKDFPKDIPFPKDSKISQVSYQVDNKQWQLFAKAPFYATDGKELVSMLKSALGKHGWQTTNIQDMPLYHEDDLGKQDIPTGGSYIIEFRKLAEQRQGSVTLVKGEPWEITIDVSEE